MKNFMEGNKKNEDSVQENKNYAQVLDAVKDYSDTIISLSKEIINSLVSISIISASLFVIATFNPELSITSISVRILITILLILISLGILVSYANYKKTIRTSFEMIQILAIKLNNENINQLISASIEKTKKPTFLGIMQSVIYFLFTLVIVILIFLIWKIDIIQFLINIF